MKHYNVLLAILVNTLFLTSCSSDDDANRSQGSYDNGLLILNEGGYTAGNASVSFLSNTDELENDIYFGVNGTPLGDVAQSIGFHNSLAYIVVNNSHKIEVVNRYTLERMITITNGIDNPRYIAFSGDRGFVTNWGDPFNTNDDYIAVIDLLSGTVTSTINIAEGPERIVAHNDKLYIAHKGGFGFGNSVSIVNTSTNTLEKTITVGDVPNSLAVKNNKLYVMCEGKPSWAGTETGGMLTIIDMNTNSISSSFTFETTQHPNNFVLDNNTAYYTIDDEIYNTDATSFTLPDVPLFTTTAQGVYGVYSFAVKDGKVYVGDALDYNSEGKLYIYSTDGSLQQTHTVGVIPTGLYFNE